MRYIYVDEAGIAETEPVTVVVGIVVEADTQYAATEGWLARLLTTVPAGLRPGFVSHAKSIWGDRKMREKWPDREERLTFLKRMVQIPSLVKLPVSVGVLRRAHPGHPGSPNVQRSFYHHTLAFALCIAHADLYVCEHGKPGEGITVVAENSPRMQPTLRAIAKMLMTSPILIPASSQRALRDRPLRDFEYRITRLKDTIHFVSKEDGPLLQIADACAFALRRYIEKRAIGDELCEVMAGRGGLVAPDDFALTTSWIFVPANRELHG